MFQIVAQEIMPDGVRDIANLRFKRVEELFRRTPRTFQRRTIIVMNRRYRKNLRFTRIDLEINRQTPR